MTVNYRPDLLPYALPVRIGLPYHGLVTNGQLALPGGGTKAYAQPTGGDVTLVRHPRSSTPAADPGHPTYTWQNYAVLSGQGKEIAGKDLGALKWIYCDAHYSWLVGIETTNVSGSFTIRAYVYSPFGLLRDKQPTYTKRLLATAVLQTKGTDGVVRSFAMSPGFISHSQTGEASAFNWFDTERTDNSKGNSYQVAAAKIQLTGNGDPNAASCGAGISATITGYTIAEMLTESSRDDGYGGSSLDDFVCGGDEVTNDVGWGPYGWSVADLGNQYIGTVSVEQPESANTINDYHETVSTILLHTDLTGTVAWSTTVTHWSGILTNWSNTNNMAQLVWNYPPGGSPSKEGKIVMGGGGSIKAGYSFSYSVFGSTGEAGSYSIGTMSNSAEVEPDLTLGGMLDVTSASNSSTTSDVSPPGGMLAVTALRLVPITNHVVDIYAENYTQLTYVGSVSASGSAFTRNVNGGVTTHPLTGAVVLNDDDGGAVCYV